MTDLISIIIPVYNIAPYIDTCLKSVCQQTYSNFEVLIIDDGSSDGSYQKCLQFAKQFSIIKVFRQNHRGVSAARNLGIKKSKGKYITFVDGDDTIELNYLEILEKYMSSNRYDVVFCGCRIIELNQNKTFFKCLEKNRAGDIKKDFFNLFIGTARNSIESSSMKLLKRSIITSNNCYFDEQHINREDTLFMLSYLQYCINYYFTTETYYNYYRYDRGSASDKYSSKRILNEIEYLKKLNEWMENNNIEHSSEILCFDIMGFTRSLAMILFNTVYKMRLIYELFSNGLNILQDNIVIPSTTDKIKTRIALSFIRSKNYLPLFIYYWIKERIFR